MSREQSRGQGYAEEVHYAPCVLYGLGVVVGKFSPLHKGHEHLIQVAFEKCSRVLIISYAKPEFEHCHTRERARWLTESLSIYGHRALIHVLPPHTTPEDLAADVIHRDFCADFIERLTLQDELDVVLSSEDYGRGFASHLSVRFKREIDHICVDLNREKYPTSGTYLRGLIDQIKNHSSQRALKELKSQLSPVVFSSLYASISNHNPPISDIIVSDKD